MPAGLPSACTPFAADPWQTFPGQASELGGSESSQVAAELRDSRPGCGLVTLVSEARSRSERSLPEGSRSGRSLSFRSVFSPTLGSGRFRAFGVRTGSALWPRSLERSLAQGGGDKLSAGMCDGRTLSCPPSSLGVAPWHSRPSSPPQSYSMRPPSFLHWGTSGCLGTLGIKARLCLSWSLRPSLSSETPVPSDLSDRDLEASRARSTTRPQPSEESKQEVGRSLVTSILSHL